MHDYLVSYLRWLGFSVCALAVALCVRVPAAHAHAAAAPAPEPRFSAPPQQQGIAAVAHSDSARIAELETQLTALSGEIANLTAALDVLGPLPEHASLFIPVALAECAGTLPDMRHARLGALGDLVPQSADLGYLRAGYEIPFHNVRLEQSQADTETIAALCVELSALTGPPRVVAPIRTG